MAQILAEVRVGAAKAFLPVAGFGRRSGGGGQAAGRALCDTQHTFGCAPGFDHALIAPCSVQEQRAQTPNAKGKREM